jgi:hypothetical protein
VHRTHVKDSHPKLASDRVLTPSRTRISSPLVIAREQWRACSNNLPRRNGTTTCARVTGQDYPITGPSPGANPPIYPSSLPRTSGNLFSDIFPKSHGFFFFLVWPDVGLVVRVSSWSSMVWETLIPGPKVTVTWFNVITHFCVWFSHVRRSPEINKQARYHNRLGKKQRHRSCFRSTTCAIKTFCVQSTWFRTGCFETWFCIWRGGRRPTSDPKMSQNFWKKKYVSRICLLHVPSPPCLKLWEDKKNFLQVFIMWQDLPPFHFVVVFITTKKFSGVQSNRLCGLIDFLPNPHSSSCNKDQSVESMVKGRTVVNIVRNRSSGALLIDLI